MPSRILAVVFLCACATAGRDQPPAAQDATPVIVDAPVVDAPEAPPDANNCATQPCDILTQCGCGAGSACDIDGTDNSGTACRSVLTAGDVESTCIDATRCDAGFVCLFDAGSSIGTCKHYCDADADCGTPRGKCIIQITSGGQPIPDIPKACSSNCDPTDPTAAGCPSGRKCGLFNANGTDIVECSVAGAGTQGASCTTSGSPNDRLCAVNFLCTTVDTTTACRKICNRTANTGCAAGEICIGFTDPFSVGGVEYGVCN